MTPQEMMDALLDARILCNLNAGTRTTRRRRELLEAWDKIDGVMAELGRRYASELTSDHCSQRHYQQGRNVWYCPTRGELGVSRPEEVDNPTYGPITCPVCGEQALPERIR